MKPVIGKAIGLGFLSSGLLLAGGCTGVLVDLLVEIAGDVAGSGISKALGW